MSDIIRLHVISMGCIFVVNWKCEYNNPDGSGFMYSSSAYRSESVYAETMPKRQNGITKSAFIPELSKKCDVTRTKERGQTGGTYYYPHRADHIDHIEGPIASKIVPMVIYTV